MKNLADNMILSHSPEGLMLLTWDVETKMISHQTHFSNITPSYEETSSEISSVNKPRFILILTTYPEAHF